MKNRSVLTIALFLSLTIVFFAATTADAGRRRDKASAENKAACENWCRQNPECVKCSTLAGCGGGFKNLKSWTGFGDNWHACAKRVSREEASRKNKADCENWCRQNPECKKCSKLGDCGPGYKDIKSWTGFGDNWHACAKRVTREEASRKNKADCENWCRNNSQCSKCSKLAGCGPGFKGIKSWTGFGDNWHACRKTGGRSINTIWPGKSFARREHRVLVVSLDGHYGYKTRGGFEWFCEDYFSGRNNNPKVACISSFAAISTRSHTLSDNIAELAREMKRKSGVQPKIILVGKSMGACKLQHAVTGVRGGKRGKLQDMQVDLFVGVDMSCGIDRHFEKGADDALYFRDNVKDLLVFYQDKSGESQTGHRGIYVGKSFNPRIHTNVNRDSFNLKREQRLGKSGKSLCRNVGHLEIDDCRPLLETIRSLILKRAK